MGTAGRLRESKRDRSEGDLWFQWVCFIILSDFAGRSVPPCLTNDFNEGLRS